VKAQFVVQFSVELGSAAQVPDATKEFAPKSHWFLLQTVRMTSWMARTRRSNSAAAFSNCFRPSAVKR
jgi:hypothetical protein